jgi:hypothetical protein
MFFDLEKMNFSPRQGNRGIARRTLQRRTILHVPLVREVARRVSRSPKSQVITRIDAAIGKKDTFLNETEFIVYTFLLILYTFFKPLVFE